MPAAGQQPTGASPSPILERGRPTAPRRLNEIAMMPPASGLLAQPRFQVPGVGASTLPISRFSTGLASCSQPQSAAGQPAAR
eukprot:3536852-Prymnesium_polylepis.1